MKTLSCFICAWIIFGAAAIPALNAMPIHEDRTPFTGDYVETAKRIIPLARRGDARAQAMLGLMYTSGQGVPQSYNMAVDWYLQSAQQGDPIGQYLLGLMYDKGFGVMRNVVLAYKWLNLAAAHAPSADREYFLRLRDAVASKMTRAELELGQELALEFIAKSR